MPPYIPEQTAYAFFGIAPTASPFEIQDAYRRLARKFPADRVWDTPMASAAKTGLQEVERWHAMIGSPEARAAYDAMLAAKRRAVTAEFHAGVDGGAQVHSTDMSSDNSHPDAEDDRESSANNRRNESDESDDSQEAMPDGDRITITGHFAEDHAEDHAGHSVRHTRSNDEEAVQVDRTALTAQGESNNTKQSELDTEPGAETVDHMPAVHSDSGLGPRKTRHTVGKSLAIALVLIIFLPLLTLRTPRLPPVDSTGPYHRLGLPEDETLNMTALRSAYHKAIRQHHPDKQSSQDRSSAALIAIAEAYTTLADPFRRCVYHRRRQVALDPACIVSLRLCGHLLPNDDDVGDDVGDDDTAEELVQDAPSDAPATSHPAQMTTFQAWHSLMQVWWNVALDAAGRLLAWLKRK